MNQLYIFGDSCIGSEDCRYVCPADALTLSIGGLTDNDGIFTPTDYLIKFEPDNCIFCGYCVDACSSGVYMMVIEDNPVDPGGPGDPGGGSGGNNPAPPTGPPQLNNQMTRPCLKGAFDKAFGGDMNSILQEFARLVGNSDGYDITFYESHLGGDDWARTRHFQNGDYHYFYITMNLDVITNADGDFAAEESLVSTMYHELLHALFETKKIVTGSDLEWGGVFQHETMARAYLDIMSDILQGIYPDLSRDDAMAINWEGLQSTQYWRDFAELNPTEANNILLRADAYDAGGSKGKRCRTSNVEEP